MKKYLILILAVVAACAAAAGDFAGFYADYVRFCENKIVKILADKDVARSRAEAGRNTYVWYLWQDFDYAESAPQKLKVLREIEKLTTNKKEK